MLGSLGCIEARLPGTGSGAFVMHVPNEAVVGFSWAIEDEIAALAKPGVARPIGEDLAYLWGQRIQLLVTLTEDPLPEQTVHRFGMRPLHLPVKDFTAPTLEQLATFMTEVDLARAASERVAVHCLSGKGRTGTFLAAYFVHLGMDPAEAIAEIRALRPGSIETKEQEEIVYRFAETDDGP